MSRQHLEAAYRGVLDRQMLEELDKSIVIACENPRHTVDVEIHDGPAAF